MKLIVFIIFAFISFQNVAQTGIQVTGKSSIMVMPDLFSFTISIKERSVSVVKAKKVVDHKSNLIVNMFIKQGINEDDIDSSTFNVYPIYEKPSIVLDADEVIKKFDNNEKIKVSLNRAGAAPSKTSAQLVRYDVTRTITVSFERLAIYDDVLDRILKLGGSHVSPMEMMIKNPEKHYELALMQAMDNAKQKALKIAKQAEVKLGRLISLSESGYYSPMRYRMASEAKTAFTSQVIKKAISAQVNVTYQIEE